MKAIGELKANSAPAVVAVVVTVAVAVVVVGDGDGGGGGVSCVGGSRVNQELQVATLLRSIEVSLFSWCFPETRAAARESRGRETCRTVGPHSIG